MNFHAMKKTLLIFAVYSFLLVSCTFEKAKPLPVGCSTTMFYATDIKPIIDSKCVTCHISGGSGTGDFTNFNELNEKINTGIFNTKVFILKDMPQSGSPQLTEDELGKLSCWLDQGAPNN